MIFDLISNSPHDLHSYTVNLKENLAVYQSPEPLFQAPRQLQMTVILVIKLLSYSIKHAIILKYSLQWD